MGKQEFNTVDVVRLEVETDPTGLVNLVQNPNGELGGWGWITPVAGSELESVPAGSPPVELRYVTVAGANYLTTEAMPITAGQYAAARWESIAGTGYLRARFEWLDAAGALLSSSAQSGYLSMVGGVQSLAPVVAPASTVSFRLRFDLYADNAGGNYTGASFFAFYGVTVAVAATSGAFGATRTNLIQNPSFETNVNGWSATPADTTLARSTAVGGQAGDAALALTAVVAGVAEARTAEGTAGIPVQGSHTYAVSYYSRAGSAGTSTAGTVVFFDAAGAHISSSSFGGSNVVGSWTRRSGIFTAPAGAAYLQVKLRASAGVGHVHYFDAVMVEEASVVGSYFDGASAAGSGWSYSWTGTAHGSTSVAQHTNINYLPPVEYLNIIGESQHIRVSREQLNAGTLSAVIRSRSLDPSQSTLLRPGRRARLTTLVDGVWETLIGGKLLEADVTYEVKDPKVPTEKQARIEVLLVDPNQALANAGRPEGVATIDELPFVLEGAGVPWNVNGSGNHVPAANVTTYNESAKALDQVALTRDTAIGYAWMSRVGVLNVWDRDQIASGAPVLLDEDDYSDIDLSFSTKDAINELQITVQSLGTDGTTTETVYGPYVDQVSIDEWGRYRKEFTVTGLDSAAVDALAAAILDAASTPRIRVNSITIPLTTIARVASHALLDLYDEVRVVLTSLGVDEVLRATGLEHTIDTKAWMLRLDFSDEGGVAVPTVQPPVQSGTRPGVGVIELFAGSTPPAGKLLCDGTSYLVADFPHLFAVIGYTFGGAGASFNVPNLVDRFPIGSGTKALGTTGGSATHTHGMTHTHTISGQATDPNTIQRAAGAVGAFLVTHATYAGHNHGGNTGIPSTANTSGPSEGLNPWLSLNFVIRAT